MYNDFANNQDAKKDKATRLNELAKKKMFLTFSVDFSIPIIVYNFDTIRRNFNKAISNLSTKVAHRIQIFKTDIRLIKFP